MSSVPKVALLVEASSAGVGRHVADLSEALRSKGACVHVLYSKRRMDQRFESTMARLEADGVKSHHVDMTRDPGPKDFLAVREVRRYVREHGPFDVLHSHSTKAGLIGRLAALGQCRSFYTPHAFLTMSPTTGRVKALFVRLLERTLSLLSNAVVCVSQEEVQHAAGLGIARRKLLNIANGIDLNAARRARTERSSVREKIGLSGDDICIGFVGRLVPQKAPEVLVAAFSRIAKDLPAARLCIVGDGPLLSDLKRQIAQAGIEDRVFFLGAVDGLTHMAAFDVFALPSCYEGFPYVLVEAIAMGLPVVSTRVGGASTLVNTGENGYTVAVGDAEAFSCALRPLLEDAELRRTMSIASEERSKSFTLDRMATEILSAYAGAAGPAAPVNPCRNPSRDSATT